MGFLNCQKQENAFRKNYFFAGTIFVIAINFLVYCFFNSIRITDTANNWNELLSFKRLLSCFLSAYQHFNLQHLLLNGLCFLIAGGYVERKRGSLGLLFLVALFTFFVEGMTNANHMGTSIGFSGVNYSFYAYIIVDFIFSLKTIKTNKTELVVSSIVLALIYIACCFCGGTESFAFKIYPYDLIYNLGHYTGFLVGLILSMVMKLCKINSCITGKG